MIGLSKNGRNLIFPENFGIDWVIEDDILDFDRLGQGYSWTVEVPIKGNEWAFHYASDPARSGNKLKVYDGFHMTEDGNIWWAVSLQVIGTTSDALSYKVYITTLDSAIYANKDKLISEIITETIAISDGSYADIIETINSDNGNPLKFPHIHFFDDRTRFIKEASSGDPFPIFDKASSISLHEPIMNYVDLGYNLLPFFKIKYIVQVTLEALGYTLRDNFTDSFTDKILIHSNRAIDQPVNPVSPECDFSKIDNVIEVNKYVPEITLFELLEDISFYTASSIKVDTQKNQVIVTNITRDISQTSLSENIIRKHYPDIETKNTEYRNLCIDYKISNDLMAQTEPTGTNRDTFTTISNFEGLSSPKDTDYGFVKEVNAYMKLVDVDGSMKAKRLSAPYWAKYSGLEDLKTLTPTMKPHLIKSSYTYKVYDVNYDLIDNGSGKIEVDGYVECTTSDSIGLVFEDQENEDLLFTPFDVTAVNSNSIELDADLPSETYKVKRVIVATPSLMIQNVVNSGVHYPEIGQENPGYKGGVVIWHGEINNSADTFTYPAAFSDNYDHDGTSLISFSLDTQGTYSIWNTKWKSIYEFLQNTKILVIKTFLSEQQFRSFLTKKSKARHAKGIMRFRSLKANLGKNLTSQEMEGYSI